MKRKWLSWVRRLFAHPKPMIRPGRRLARALRLEGLEPRLVPALFGGGVYTALGDLNGDGYADLVTAAGPGGGPHVQVFSGKDGSLLRNFFAYDAAFHGGVTVAVGDVTGDGTADLVTGAGSGGGPHVEVFDGKTGSIVRSFFAFDGSFTGGVNVATADLNGDGFADLIVGSGPGTASQVKVFSGKDGSVLRTLAPYPAAFLGGVNVAGGDVTGDGTPDLVTGAGPGGGPHVEVFDGKTGAVVRSFFAYSATFTGGVNVAAGDVDGDGAADVITGAGPGGGPHVEVFGGPDASLRQSFFAYPSTFLGGVHIAVGDVDGDGRGADFATGAGPGGGPHVRILGGIALNEIASFFAFSAGSGPGAFAKLGSSAPPPAMSTADFRADTDFLYTGSNPVQTGVAAGTIDAIRAAVLRGTVVDRAAQPLPGVTVVVLGHPEFGRTTTAADGTFSLAVNGGGLLTAVFTKDGYLAVQRPADVPWRDYTILPTVALTPLDSRVTTVDLSSTAAIQVAQGNVTTDANGSRQATLLFPQGEQATMTLPDGTTQPLTTLGVRATEYTVGGTGPEAMPGALPSASGYTYCVELSVDQAQQAGATQVNFSQAIPFYVQNFLNFPVGMSVPSGYYDRTSGTWVASPNGRVIQVLSVTSGEANLDTDGDGNPDTAGALAALGITDAERTQLATLYRPGQSVWRVPIAHFTPRDFNWPDGPPNGASGPGTDPNSLNDHKENNATTTCVGSVVYVENQTLGETIPIVGTPFSLVYQSGRVTGDVSDRTLTIPLTQQTLPPGLKRIELTIHVAGREFTQHFDPSANLSAGFTWDGLDAFGRTLDGSVPAKVQIAYVYDGVYQTPADAGQAFGLASGAPLPTIPARQEVSLYQTLNTELGHVASASSLGGWTLDVQNSYDPVSQILHLGDGTDRGVDNTLNATIVTTVGQPSGGGFTGDGGPATLARLNQPTSVAIGPDGSEYIADSGNSRVRRVSPDGVITTFAGNGTRGSDGDGGPATLASLTDPTSVAVGPDGSVYINEGGVSRIRRVAPDGTITTFAGHGVTGINNPDPMIPVTAQQALFSSFTGENALAVGPDGSLYIADSGNNLIRRVGPDGLVTTVAGDGGRGFAGDDGPAALARLNGPSGMAIGPDGSIYIADAGNARIRRVGPDGIISTVAGNGLVGSGGDGGPAKLASISTVLGGIAVDSDGSVYFSDQGNLRIRVVTPSNLITTLAGGGTLGADGVPAGQAQFTPRGLAIDHAGHLDFAVIDGTNRIRSIVPALPGFNAAAIAIPSADGSELYQFDSVGRHLKTLDALTGAVIYTFAYDADGRLTSVKDGDNNTTTIDRTATGAPIDIVGPYGQRTVLSVTSAGYLATVTDPAKQTTTLGYGAGGLLTGFTDPNSHSSLMTYDVTGRIISDHDAADGFTTFDRLELGDGSYQVKTTNAVDGTRIYKVENLPDGIVSRTAIDGRGFATVTLIGTNGSRTTNLPDGTIDTVVLGPDPRFGMLAPIAVTQTTATPGHVVSTTTDSRTVTFATPGDPTSALATLTDTVVVNGKTFTTTYAAATHTVTSTSDVGRTNTTTIDSRGRTVAEAIPGVDAIAYTYDLRGRLFTISQGNRTVTYTYDTSGNLAVIKDPLGRTTTLAYDAAGRITKQTQPDGSMIVFQYDAAGNMTGITPPGKLKSTFSYDPHDDLVSSTPPAVGATDDTTRYTYNLAHQLVGETLPGGADITFAYCECGRLTSITAPWGEYTYEYSSTTGELSSLESPGGFKLVFGKDGILDTSETLSGPVSGSVAWTYNSNFEVASESVDNANLISFKYDDDGLLTTAGALTLTRDTTNGRVTGTTIGTVADSVGYNEFGEEASYQVTANGATPLQDTDTRDDLGRIMEKVETVGGVTTTTDYGYDLKGQLTTVKENGMLVQKYDYDSNGNRLTLTTQSGMTHGTYDNQDRLLTYGTKTYTYARDGSLKTVTDSATGQTTTYTYDAFGNLTQVAFSVGPVITYLIDGENRRVGKEVNGVLTQGLLYDGQLTPVAALNADGSIAERFVYSTAANVPAYMIKDGVTYRLITDNLGSVRLVVNVATGTVAQAINYDAFGRVTNDTKPGFQPFGYAGGLYDADTGLVRFGARDYDAAIGRWTARDPIGFQGGATNLFEYSRNAPVNRVDPGGLLDEFSREERNREVAAALSAAHGNLNGALDNIYLARNANGGTRKNDAELVNADHYLAAAILARKYGASVAVALVLGYEGFKCGPNQFAVGLNNVLATIQDYTVGGVPPYMNYPSPPSLDSAISGLEGIAAVVDGTL